MGRVGEGDGVEVRRVMGRGQVSGLEVVESEEEWAWEWCRKSEEGRLNGSEA